MSEYDSGEWVWMLAQQDFLSSRMQSKGASIRSVVLRTVPPEVARSGTETCKKRGTS